MGVSSIQSQTPLLCRVHKGGVLFFRLPRFRRTNVLIRSAELSPMRLPFPSKLLLSWDFFTRSLPRWAEREVMSEKVCKILLLRPVQGFFAHFSNLFTRSSAST